MKPFESISPSVYPVAGGGVIVTDLSMLPRCRLAKMQSDDGLWEYNGDHATIGKVYIYSPKSRRVALVLHEPTGIEHECEIVLVYDERGFFAMMPTECLDFT